MPFAYTSYKETYDETTEEHKYVFTTVPCIYCGKTREITVQGEDLFKYHQGESVQSAFPYLSAGDREQLFMSNICDACWQDMFKDEDE